MALLTIRGEKYLWIQQLLLKNLLVKVNEIIFNEHSCSKSLPGVRAVHTRHETRHFEVQSVTCAQSMKTRGPALSITGYGVGGGRQDWLGQERLQGHEAGVCLETGERTS